MADFHFHFTITDPRVTEILDQITKIGSQMSQMDDELVQLTADVAATRGAVDSAVALINGIAAKIAAAVADALAKGATPAQLQSITDLDAAVKAEGADLAAAVAANP